MNRNKVQKMLTTFLLFAMMSTLIIATNLSAQMKMMIQGDGEIFMLQEVGAIISENDKKLVVMMVMPEHMRPKAYKDVDMQKDDEILMVNGKRVKSVADIRTIVDALKPGDRLSFGLKRGKDMQIVSLVKADPADLPKMSISKDFDTDDMPNDGEGAPMVFDGIPGENVIVLILSGSGLVITDSDDGVMVAHVLPNAADLFGEYTPVNNDLIVSLQGTKQKTAEQLAEFYDSIKVGEKITLIISHEGKERTLTFDKLGAEAPGTMMITD